MLAATAAAHAPPGVEVVCGDASTTSAYAGAVPADLVLVCGIFGNISDDDIHRTVEIAAERCARRARPSIWTRHRRPPDLTVDVRAAGSATPAFEEIGFAGSRRRSSSASARTGSTGPPAARTIPTCRCSHFVGYDELA